MSTLPTADEMLDNAELELNRAYVALSDADDWLNSDWRPAGTTLTAEQARRRRIIRRAITAAKSAINEGKASPR